MMAERSASVGCCVRLFKAIPRILHDSSDEPRLVYDLGMACNVALVTNVTTDSAAAYTVITGNRGRKGIILSNDTDVTQYIKFGSGATTSAYSFKLVAGGIYESYGNYTGLITAIAASAPTGKLNVTELSG